MVLADIIDYKPRKIFDQGQVPACKSYAFSTTLMELLENEDTIVDIDPLQVEDQMNKFIFNYKGDKGAVKNWYLKMGKEQGISSNKGMIHVTGGRNIYPDPYTIARCLQKHGPVIISIKIFEDHDLTTEPIEMPPDTKVIAGHELIIRGHDREKKTFTWQNSWGEKLSVRTISYEVLKKIIKDAYVIYHLTLTT